MQEIAIRLHDERRHQFRRVLAVSGALHAVVFGMMAWSPAIPVVNPPAAVMIDLVAAPSLPGAKARPRPRPKPPKPAPVVLPAQPTTPKPQAKPAPAPEPAPEEEQVEYDDLMAQLRAEAGEPDPSVEEPVETASIGGGGGPGLPIPPELAAWMRDARIHVRRTWVVPPAFEMESLVVEVKIDLDSAGNVKGTPSVSRRSGNPWYDENVIRSIQKASPLPAPPEPGAWTFVFYSNRDA